MSIYLHIGICIFLILGFVEEFEGGKKIFLNFDLVSLSFYRVLSYCIAFFLIILYTMSSLLTGIANKELSILFSFSVLFGGALHCYIENQELISSVHPSTNDTFLSWTFMSGFPILLIMIAFSPLIYPSSTTDNNTFYIDSDLLRKPLLKDKYFWRIHRIFSILLFVLAFEFCVHIFSNNKIEWVIISVSIFFFINSILLWFLPKLGSIFLSIFCMILICGIYYLFISKPPKEIIIICIPLFITLSFGSIPFILLNKDARQEWKMK